MRPGAVQQEPIRSSTARRGVAPIAMAGARWGSREEGFMRLALAEVSGYLSVARVYGWPQKCRQRLETEATGNSNLVDVCAVLSDALG